MIRLLIFPYNGNGLEALDCLERNFELLGFIDDTKEKHGIAKEGIGIYPRDKIEELYDAKILAIPGSPISFRSRKEIIDSLCLKEDRFATVIHPKATISPLARIGYNVLIMAGVVITSNAVIGNHVCILPNTVIHHDVQIGDYSLIGSNVTVAGNTKIGNNCYVGSGSSIINGVEIGDKTLVGIGTNVTKTFPQYSKLVGNPARSI